MRDVAPISLLAGLAGAAVVDGLTLLERWLGLKTQTPWGIAAASSSGLPWPIRPAERFSA